MSMSASLHDAKKMTAGEASGTSWLKIEGDYGHVVAYIPYAAAKATADAFNAAMAAHEAEGDMTLTDFAAAQPAIQDQTQ